MSDSRVLTIESVGNVLEYIASTTTDATAHLYLTTIHEHIEAQNAALEKIAGECGWLSEAEQIAAHATNDGVS